MDHGFGEAEDEGEAGYIYGLKDRGVLCGGAWADLLIERRCGRRRLSVHLICRRGRGS